MIPLIISAISFITPTYIDCDSLTRIQLQHFVRDTWDELPVPNRLEFKQLERVPKRLSFARGNHAMNRVLPPYVVVYWIQCISVAYGWMPMLQTILDNDAELAGFFALDTVEVERYQSILTYGRDVNSIILSYVGICSYYTVMGRLLAL